MAARRELRRDRRAGSNGNGAAPSSGDGPAAAGGGRRKRPRIKKLRVAAILAGLGLLALVSTVFGMMMAVSQDLPAIENYTEFRTSQNSQVFDATGKKIGTLTGNNNRILDASTDISQNMKQAVVAVEDRRFYEHQGVDFRGIGRAILQDVVTGSGQQGGSTITEQFVKNALEAQNSRTVFEKLREAALAYHLEKRWTKDKILTTYLNTIYFGEGAYGIEAAARTYFGHSHPGCENDGPPTCASLLLPEQAAMLAGIISSPSAYDPRLHPEAALGRRNHVLKNMYDQGVLSGADFRNATAQALPAPSQIEPPREDSRAPYFTSWLRQQIVDRYGAGAAFSGGLRIRTTLDLELQQRAETAITSHLAGIAPTGSAVVIDNRTGGVKAMVGGFDFRQRPFNLATNGHRQPGSSFKPFTLITALAKGRSPNEVFTSELKRFPVPGSPHERFVVHNYNDTYVGSRTLANATTFSDNSVYAQLGLQVGTKAIKRTAQNLGIETNISTNPAMILGGLKHGVTPLEMAYAYNSIAHDGERVSGTLGSLSDPKVPPADRGPVAIQEVKDSHGRLLKGGKNQIATKRVIPAKVDHTAIQILQTVVASGTGKRAQTGSFAWGKTGTTENNGDAWFCGATHEITACVWVGHADSNQPMETEFAGQPVDGGTFPAQIWHDIVVAFQDLQVQRGLSKPKTPIAPVTPGAVSPAPAAPAPQQPAAPAPTPVPQQPPAAAPVPPADGGGTGGGATGGGDGAATGASTRRR
ncbi:MAG: penicillin-binding protein [Solirubrobacterales bacterium]|jgi:penicillin-binding protein 1A|nr:penicillin-binding protein [Solirubrobacterales bacterium]